MSADTKAREILLAISEFFNQGAPCVYADALMFEDSRTLKEHIDEVVERFETTPVSGTRSDGKTKRKISKNYYGNWVGFEGKKKVRDFGKFEEAALRWLWDDYPPHGGV